LLPRIIVGVVMPVSLIALTLLPLFWFQERLPDPLATHWGTSRPNGNMSFTFLVLFEFVFVTLPAAGMALAARRNPAYKGEISRTVAITAFVATMIAIVSWEIVAANLDVAVWSEARMVGFTDIGILVAGALAVAFFGAFVARSLEIAERPKTVNPSAGLAPGARAIWVGTARSRWALPMLVVFGGIGIVNLVNQQAIGALLFALVALLAVPFTSIRVTADRHGVEILYGAVGWPKQTIPLADIRRASAVDVVPMERGGWGYRGTLRLFGRAAIVLRGGDGLALELAGDRKLTITVDDAIDGAGLINDLVGASPDS
jgi:hypothetical protein